MGSKYAAWILQTGGRLVISESTGRPRFKRGNALRGLALAAAFCAAALPIPEALADTEQVGGSVTVDTPQSNVPHPIFPTGTVITDFTSYAGPFPYVLGTFTVNLSGFYSANLLTPSVQNGFYIIEGAFSPSLNTPSTPLSNVLAFIQDLTSSTMTLSLDAGKTYSYLAIFSTGNSAYTFTVGGPGCIALTTTCWIDTSKPYFVETDSRARGETIVFDGGTLRPTASITFAQPITLNATGGIIDTTTAPVVTLSGPIKGPGGLTIDGGNTVVLTGSNTYSGGTTILAGSLIASAQSLGRGDILNHGLLIFDQAEDGKFACDISGGGSLTKEGEGRLELTGTSSLVGPTIVQAGTLTVNGSLRRSLVTVAENASLSGDGVIGGLEASSGSIIAPGNSIGRLRVKGDANFAPGAIYQVEVNGNGKADALTTTGVIRLSSRTVLNIILVDGSYRASVPYLIMKAGGGIKGRFAHLPKDLFPFVEATLNYTEKTVSLTLKPKLPPGEVYGSAITSTYMDDRIVQSALLSRLRNAPHENEVGLNKLPPESGPSLWGQALGSWGQIQHYGSAASLERSTGGFLMGAEAQLDHSTRLGFAGGFLRTSFEIDHRFSSGSAESIVGSLYGGKEWGAVRLRWGAAFASHDVEAERDFGMAGAADQSSASYRSTTLQSFGEVGYALSMGAVQLEPFVGAAAFRLQTNGFDETGGAAALKGYPDDYKLGTTTLGAHLDAALSDEIPISLNATLGWLRAYGSLVPQAVLSSSGDGTISRASGAPVDRDALVAEIGLHWQPTPSTNLSVLYQGQVGARGQDHALKGGLTWSF